MNARNKKESNLSLLEAIETLSNIADLEYDREVGIAQAHDHVVQNKQLIYHTVHWLHHKSVNVTINMVKDTFRVVLNYLRNFYSKEYHNLEIADGSVMTAVNCYNIDKVDENESGVISLINQSTVPLSDAGCGFTVPFSDSSQSLLKKVIENPETQIKIKEKTDREMVLKLRKIQLQ